MKNTPLLRSENDSLHVLHEAVTAVVLRRIMSVLCCRDVSSVRS